MKHDKILLLSLIILVGVFFTTGDAYAAWTQAKGHSYNQLTLSHYKSKNLFSTVEHGNSDKVRRVDSAQFLSTDVSYYGEYGLIDKLTIFTSFAWKQPESDDTILYADEDGPSGIGDIDLGLRYNLSPNLLGTGVLMSLQGTVKIPEAYDYGFPLTHLSAGDGQYDTTATLMFGRGLGKAYLLFNVGYKYRFENDNNIDEFPSGIDSSDDFAFKPSDQLKVFIGGGYALPKNFELRASIDWTKSLGNADASDELLTEAFGYGVGANEMYKLIKDTLSLEQDVLNVGLGLAYTLPKKMLKGTWQAVLTYNQDIAGVGIFKTKNAGQGTTYSAALVYMH